MRRVRPELRTSLATLLLAAVAVAVYAGTLRHGFPFDDEIHVVRNLDVRDLGRAARAFLEPTWPGNLYRPLPALSYALTHAVVGLDPLLYHATNVLLNAAVVALAYLCLVRVTAAPLAFAAVLLFALHPLHVEAVASIANRTELFAAFFGLAALLAVAPGRATAPPAGPLRGALGAAALLAALLAKESALVFLPLALLTTFAVRRFAVARCRVDLAALAWLGGAAAVYFVLRVVALGGLVPAGAEISPIDNPLVALPTAERLLRAAVLLGRYVLLSFIPARPSADYSFGTPGLGEDPWSAGSLAALGALAAIGAVAAVGLARRHETGFFALWFLLAFAVTANVAFPIGTIFADRLTYVPSLGLCGLAAWTLFRIRSAPVRTTAVAAIGVLLAVRTVSYAAVWRDTDALFRYQIAIAPESVKVQNGWAEALSRAGRLPEARRHFETALSIHPGYAGAALGLAVVALKEGDGAGAEAWLERAVAIDPQHVPSLVLLGRIALKQGRIDEAGELFVRAMNADNASFDARLGALVACLERGNLAQAEALRKELVERDPTHPELEAIAASLDQRLASASAE